MDKQAPQWFVETLSRLIDRQALRDEQVRLIFEHMMSGQCGDLEAASLLAALRTKGETAEEIAAAARVLRDHMVRFETGRSDVLDTCGTGGDGTGTFNISTATALVVAGAGVPVVKHGNRAASSQSGSADVLPALGVPLQEDPGWVQRCFQTAEHFHPALRHLAAVRQRLKIRTIINCLGPLANPAGAAYQLLGVGHCELLDPMAGALAQLGIRHAFLVCGRDGLDEVSLGAPTLVREVRGQSVQALEWSARDFDLEPCALSALTVTGPAESAALIRTILAGRPSPAARVVLANAAAALLAAEKERLISCSGGTPLP
ncbi:MAG: anthranilate phosphoribosyltransferase [Planctomycetota bacterium]|nr:MAG: anthranilate phosphoribosyltransferase [Planctomycetota bacterium]